MDADGAGEDRVGADRTGDDAAREQERRRAARRRAVFGDDDRVSSADETDDADRLRDTSTRDADGRSADRRWYDEQRPPHHDQR